jgi:thiol:disulfide interchange protein DsbD
MPSNLFKIVIVFLFFFSSGKVISQTSGYVKIQSYINKEKYSSTGNDTIKIALKISISENYHINSYEVNDPTLIKTSIVSSSDKFNLLNTFFPKDKKLKFEFSDNELNVYEGEINVGLTFIPIANLENDNYEITIKINYQACDDKVCYPPKSVTENVKIIIDNNASKTEANANPDIFKSINFSNPTLSSIKQDESKSSLKENQRTDTPNSDEDQVSDWIAQKGLATALILIFFGGLALNLTPCVYPLIPITVSFFGAQTSGSKSQSILMGVFYALGMSITYSALGVFAALTGGLLGTALQNPVVIIFIALIMFTLGTSMFGLFEIRVPQSLALMGNKNRSGYFGSLLMGLTVGFIAAPCIRAPVYFSCSIFKLDKQTSTLGRMDGRGKSYFRIDIIRYGFKYIGAFDSKKYLQFYFSFVYYHKRSIFNFV